jgi:hypothetical protein
MLNEVVIRNINVTPALIVLSSLQIPYFVVACLLLDGVMITKYRLLINVSLTNGQIPWPTNISLDFSLLGLHEGCHLYAPCVKQHLNTDDSSYISHTESGQSSNTVQKSPAL